MEGLEPPQHRLTVYRSTNWTTLPYEGDLSIIARHVLLITKAYFVEVKRRSFLSGGANDWT